MERRTPGRPHWGHFQPWGLSSIWAVIAGDDSLLYNILVGDVSESGKISKVFVLLEVELTSSGS